MKNRGTIIQIVGKEALVLTNPGKFIYVKVSASCEIGDLIHFDDSKIIYIQNWMKKFPYIAAVFISAFILGAMLLMTYKVPSERTLAVVSVDINPSVEFNVSEELKVIGIQPLNQDASKVLSGIKLMNMELGDAISKFVVRSADLGYLKSKQPNYILLSGALIEAKPQGNEKLKQNLDETLNGIAKVGNAVKNLTINWKVLQGSPSQLSTANENGISLGRYILYDNEHRNNTSVSFKEYEKSDISNLIKTYEQDELDSIKNIREETTEKPKLVEESPTYTPTPSVTSLTTIIPSPIPNIVIDHNSKKTEKPLSTLTPIPESNFESTSGDTKAGNDNKNGNKTPLPAAAPTVTQDTSNGSTGGDDNNVDSDTIKSTPENTSDNTKTGNDNKNENKTPLPAPTPVVNKDTGNESSGGDDNHSKTHESQHVDESSSDTT